MLQVTGVVSGVASVILSVVHLPIALYVIGVLGFSVVAGRSLRERAWLAVVLPTMHLSWGAGFLVGLVRGAKDTIDTSRLDRNTPLP